MRSSALYPDREIIYSFRKHSEGQQPAHKRQSLDARVERRVEEHQDLQQKDAVVEEDAAAWNDDDDLLLACLDDSPFKEDPKG